MSPERQKLIDETITLLENAIRNLRKFQDYVPLNNHFYRKLLLQQLGNLDNLTWLIPELFEKFDPDNKV